MRYAYPCDAIPDEPPGSYMITFQDLHEAVTGGESLGEAMENAAEVLELTLASRMKDGTCIPEPSRPIPGQDEVALSPNFAAKLALYLNIVRAGISREELARRIGASPEELDDLTDPCQTSPIGRLARALQVVGIRIVVEDIPDTRGEHFTEPHGNGVMAIEEFIRRIRRYALAHETEWQIMDQPDEEEKYPGTISLGGCLVKLPEEDITQEALAGTLAELGIDPTEF